MFRSTVLIASLLTAVAAINRPVYKVRLTQKGYTQFIRYDLDTPMIKEFTFCSWFSVHDFTNEQTLFSYVLSGNTRVIRLWLDSGGQHLAVSIMDYVSSRVPIDLGQATWRHICLSYQSDFGAWAIYIDSRLAICEAAKVLQGYILPAGGSIVLGYGVSDTGTAGGLEGEIYGASMILTSTFERNFAIKNHMNPKYSQFFFRKKKTPKDSEDKYIVLDDLKPDEINNIERSKLPTNPNQPPSNIKFQTPHVSIRHYVGKYLTTSKPEPLVNSGFFDFEMDSPNDDLGSKEQILTGNPAPNPAPKGISYYPIVEKTAPTQDYPSVSEFEIPPKPDIPRIKYFDYNDISEKSIPIFSDHKSRTRSSDNKVMHLNHGLSEYESPPPPVTDNKVYGQWVSSKFAGNILNYIKKVNLNSKPKVPATITLTKISDTHPYPSEMKVNILKPPTNLRKKSNNADYHFNSNQFSIPFVPVQIKHRNMQKREIRSPEVNVKILKNDFRNEIMNSHAKTKVRNVEISNRGQLVTKTDVISPKNKRKSVHYDEDYEYDVSPFGSRSTYTSSFNGLPFLKTMEYFTGNLDEKDKHTSKIEDMYTKSFTIRDKWHNIKPYGSNYLQQQDFDEDTYSTESITEINKMNSTIRLKYVPESNKIVENQDESIIKARELARDVSNYSQNDDHHLSLIKYNHGFLPAHDKKTKKMNRSEPKFNLMRTNKFNTRVKIGNALNEKYLKGADATEDIYTGAKTQIPDINEYRSDIDNVQNNVPPSLKPKVCQSVELYDNILYIQPDGSIDMSHILSPIKSKNEAIEFILHNYKSCTLDDSLLNKHELLLINWSKTPMRLFGGARAKQTKDLCGFF